MTANSVPQQLFAQAASVPLPREWCGRPRSIACA